MTDSSPVLYSADNGIATITLNRPSSLNAMTTSLMKALMDAVEQVTADTSVRVLVLTGAGRGFCAGADLTDQAAPESTKDTAAAATTSADASARAVDYFNGALRALYDCPVPTVARVNGAAAGGGFGLALACDITLAAKSAFFVATFGPNLGIVPDLGTTWNLPRKVGRARAMGLALLGDRVSAEQAEDWGLIWKAAPDEELDAELNRITDILVGSSPEAVTRIRATLDAASDTSFSDQLDLEMDHQAVLIPQNMAEGARAFFEKRRPNFPGRK